MTVQEIQKAIEHLKVGDTVYGFWYPQTGMVVVSAEKIVDIEYLKDGSIITIETTEDYYNLEDYNKRFFLNKEKAGAYLVNLED